MIEIPLSLKLKMHDHVGHYLTLHVDNRNSMMTLICRSCSEYDFHTGEISFTHLEVITEFFTSDSGDAESRGIPNLGRRG